MPKKKTQQQSTFFTSPRWAYVGSLLLSLLLILIAFKFQHRLEQFKSLGLLGIFFINLFSSATVFLPAPGIASVVAGGVVYPPLFVGIVAALGAACGDMVSYFLGRSGKHIVLNHTEHILYIRFKQLFSKFADIIIFVFALIPNPLFDAVGILAGVSEFPPVRFFLLMFGGRFVRNFLLALAGAKL